MLCSIGWAVSAAHVCYLPGDHKRVAKLLHCGYWSRKGSGWPKCVTKVLSGYCGPFDPFINSHRTNFLAVNPSRLFISSSLSPSPVL